MQCIGGDSSSLLLLFIFYFYFIYLFILFVLYSTSVNCGTFTHKIIFMATEYLEPLNGRIGSVLIEVLYSHLQILDYAWALIKQTKQSARTNVLWLNVNPVGVFVIVVVLVTYLSLYWRASTCSHLWVLWTYLTWRNSSGHSTSSSYYCQMYTRECSRWAKRYGTGSSILKIAFCRLKRI